jgi:hypothetical protein
VLIWHRGDGDTVCKVDAFDEHGQAAFALESAPGFRGRHDELEDHHRGGVV